MWRRCFREKLRSPGSLTNMGQSSTDLWARRRSTFSLPSKDPFHHSLRVTVESPMSPAPTPGGQELRVGLGAWF